VKALSLHQPWASLIALSVKRIETRSWSTKYRGPLAIHATKQRPGACSQFRAGDPEKIERYCEYIESANGFGYRWIRPLGAIVATVNLVDVVPMQEEIPPQPWNERWKQLTVGPPDHRYLTLDSWPGWGSADGYYVGDQLPYGLFESGRFAWLLDNIKPLAEPIPATGHQGLWSWGGDRERAIDTGRAGGVASTRSSGGVLLEVEQGISGKTAADIAQETAQVVICALALAEAVGFDLLAEVRSEWDACNKREWQPAKEADQHG
jgi:hypothetical protein